MSLSVHQAAPSAPKRWPWLHTTIKAFNANKTSWLGLVIFLLVTIVAVLAPWLAPHDPPWSAPAVAASGAGQFAEAEQSLLKAYELDAANPVVGYHLAALLLRRNELTRSQFYIRRLNNSQYANSESLWLGIKVERALGDSVAMKQLADQLRKRFPDSRELGAYERGAFNE